MKYVNRFRPSPAMVVAVLALCLSMGGIGYAAGKIGSKDLKVDAVKSRHIAGGAVTKPAIHRGAVVSVKLAKSAVTRQARRQRSQGREARRHRRRSEQRQRPGQRHCDDDCLLPGRRPGAERWVLDAAERAGSGDADATQRRRRLDFRVPEHRG